MVVGRGGGGGRTQTTGILPGGLARQRYHCEVCGVAIISYDIKTHYKSKTNWEILDKMNKGIELEEEEVEPHTRYMYENKLNMQRLPSYLTHKMEKKTKRGPMDIFLNSNKVKEGHQNNVVNEIEI